MTQIPCVENHTKVEGSTPVSQSQSPTEFVTEPTKDGDQSHAEPSQKEEELQADGCLGREEQTMNEKLEDEEAKALQSDAEEEERPVSPVLDLGSSLDMEVMELMTSSPPPSLLNLSSPNSLAPSRRGKGRILRPPPCSSRPSDDLSIRLRQSPFSTEASPETSPARTPVTPPPLTPPSPPLMCRDSPPLFEVSLRVQPRFVSSACFTSTLTSCSGSVSGPSHSAPLHPKDRHGETGHLQEEVLLWKSSSQAGTGSAPDRYVQLSLVQFQFLFCCFVTFNNFDCGRN